MVWGGLTGASVCGDVAGGLVTGAAALLDGGVALLVGCGVALVGGVALPPLEAAGVGEVVAEGTTVVVDAGEVAEERPGSVFAAVSESTPADASAPTPSHQVARVRRARPSSRSIAFRTPTWWWTRVKHPLRAR